MHVCSVVELDDGTEGIYTVRGIWPGDADEDGDVDIDDFAQFAICLSGPDNPSGPSCQVLDFDADGDTDVADLAVFQRNFTGEL